MQMPTKPLLAIAVLALLSTTGLSGPASSQVPTAKSAGLDADPSTGSAPDPLTPPVVIGPAPAAPGAPTIAETPAPDSIDPIVLRVRERLAVPPARGNAGDRDDQAGLAAFYAQAAQPIWTGKDGFTPRATAAVAEIRKADDWGLRASAFDLPATPDASATPEAMADTEIKLSIAVLKYARHARGGRVDPSSISRMLDQKPTIYDPKTLLLAVAANDAVDAYLRGLHPQHPQFEKLRQAMLEARGVRVEDTPSTPPAVRIPAGSLIKPGQDHAQVALVRQRLGVPATDGPESVFDEALVEAVKTYQREHGLQATGSINAATRAALNGTTEARPAPSSGSVQRIIVNMERWRWMPANLGALYVWDAVPEQMTSVVQGGKVLLSEKIVVGKPNTPTPVFSADMQFVIFHPSWGVPPGMKTNELAPQLRKTGGGWFFGGTSASSVLRGHGLQVMYGGRPIDPDSVNWSSVDVRNFDFVQPPGPTNVLGMVKFRFPNKHDVYMHDTPERHLFGGAQRAFSHGCMRVQNPIRLAEVLLSADKGWSTDKVQQYARSGGEIKLDKPIPVHVTYFTATVDDAGKVRYFGDIYGMDSRIASALEGRSVQLASAIVTSSATKDDDGASEAPVRKKSTQQRARQKGPPPSQGFNPFNW